MHWLPPAAARPYLLSAVRCLFTYKVSALCLGLQEGGSRLIVTSGNCALCLLHPGAEWQRGGSPRKSWDASE